MTNRNLKNVKVTIQTLRSDNGFLSLSKSSNTSTCTSRTGEAPIADAVPATALVNTLIISASPAVGTTYVAGVNVSDVVKINRYINNTETPSAWQRVASDAVYDGIINSTDITAIQNVILGTWSNFGPNGNNILNFVSDNDLSDFYSFPFYNVYGQPANENYIQGGFSKNQIQANNYKVLKIHGIKVGDVTSGGNTATSNTLLCGTGAYFSDKITENRVSYQKLHKGQKIMLKLKSEQFNDIAYARQANIKINGKVVKVLNDINTNKMFFNKITNELVAIDYAVEGLSEDNIFEATLLLEILEDCNASELVEEGHSIYVDKDVNEITSQINLEVVLSAGNENNFRVLTASKELEYYSTCDCEQKVQITNMNGQIVSDWYQKLESGLNRFAINGDLPHGLFIIRIGNESLKFINQN